MRNKGTTNSHMEKIQSKGMLRMKLQTGTYSYTTASEVQATDKHTNTQTAFDRTRNSGPSDTDVIMVTLSLQKIQDVI